MYNAVKVGEDFLSLCRAGASGKVHSVFDRALNIEPEGREDDAALFTLAHSGSGDTLSTLITTMRECESWRDTGIEAGCPVTFTRDAVYLGGKILVDGVSGADVWRPADSSDLLRAPRPAAKAIRLSCARAASHIRAGGSRGSVYQLVIRAPEVFERTDIDGGDPFLQQFLKGISVLRRILLYNRSKQEAACFEDAVKMLLGLGCGLTPSGDDFLAGMLYAVHFAQAVYERSSKAAAMLSNAVLANMKSRTNRISCHFLQYAAQGKWGRNSEEFMLALLSHTDEDGDRLRRAVNEKLGYGATSGMDEMFGAMFGFCEIIRSFEEAGS